MNLTSTLHLVYKAQTYLDAPYTPLDRTAETRAALPVIQQQADGQNTDLLSTS